jgi:hypothetical protein
MGDAGGQTPSVLTLTHCWGSAVAPLLGLGCSRAIGWVSFVYPYANTDACRRWVKVPQCWGWAMVPLLPLGWGWAMAPLHPQGWDGQWLHSFPKVGDRQMTIGWDREGCAPRRMYFWAGVWRGPPYVCWEGLSPKRGLHCVHPPA